MIGLLFALSIICALTSTLAMYFKDKACRLQKEIDEKKDMWSYFESRFVKCSTCSEENKDKCPFSITNTCDGSQCNVFIDLESLISKGLKYDEDQF